MEELNDRAQEHGYRIDFPIAGGGEDPLLQVWRKVKKHYVYAFSARRSVLERVLSGGEP